MQWCGHKPRRKGAGCGTARRYGTVRGYGTVQGGGTARVGSAARERERDGGYRVSIVLCFLGSLDCLNY